MPLITIGVPATPGYVAKLVCTVTVDAAANENSGIDIARIKAIARTVIEIDIFFKLYSTLPSRLLQSGLTSNISFLVKGFTRKRGEILL